jgi:hypothetical protein
VNRRIPIRKSTSPDVGRMSAGLQRPGIDTRVWSSLAYAEGDSAVFADGVFVDVVLLPTGEKLTARVPAEYAGNSFGLYAKVYEHDELLVEIPRGDPAEGAVVSRRLWNKRDAPPAQAVSEPEDVLLVVKPEKTLRLITSGAGKVFIKSAATVIVDCPNIRLGEEAAAEQYVLGTTFRSNLSTSDTAAVGALTALATALGTAGATLALAGANVVFALAFPISAAAIAAAGAALTAGAAALSGWISALTAFNGQAATHLSNVTKGK